MSLSKRHELASLCYIGTGAMGKLAGWASIVLIRNNERLILQFHKFSFVVWIIWLIPMVTGMILGSDF